MSFEEKSAWITGIAIAVCWAGYLIVAVSNLQAEGFMEAGYAGPLIVSVILTVVVIIASFAAVAILSPKTAGERDERDRDIERYGYFVSQFVTGATTIGVVALAIVHSDYFWIANLAYAGLVLGEITSSIARVAAYRFGIHQW